MEGTDCECYAGTRLACWTRLSIPHAAGGLWLLVLDEDVCLAIACLWRLVEDGQIGVTSQDDGQQFGLPARVDAAAEVNHRLAGARVEAVELRKGILDL